MKEIMKVKQNERNNERGDRKKSRMKEIMNVETERKAE